ncbi:MAG: DUF5677 domain-containing protein [Candidatus Latescibacterota bacterium]
MRFENPFSVEDLDRARLIEATPEMHADAWFVGVQAYAQFVEEFMKPALRGLIARSLREDAVLDLYYGIVGFLFSVNVLRDPWHVRAIATCARSVFELYNDLLLLTQGSQPAERFRGFVDVEKLRVAKARVAFYDGHPELSEGREPMDPLRDFVRDDGPRIEAEVERLWSGQWPWHWSGIHRARERAKAAGLDCEALFWRFYARLSWYVHTASVGTLGLRKRDFHMVIAEALELLRLTVPTAFGIVAREAKLEAVIENLETKLEFLRRVFFFRLTALKLGQPERFTFL